MNSLRILLIWVLTASVLLGQAVLPNRRKVFQSAGGGETTLNDGLIAYWKMDEEGGNTVNRVDSWGSNDLDAFGATITNGVGIVNNSLNIERDNIDYAIIADNADLSFGDEDMSIAVWGKLEAIVAGNMYLVHKAETATDREYMLYYDGTANRFKWAVSSDGAALSTVTADTFGAASTGTYYFIAAGHVAGTDTIWISVNAGTKDTASHTTGIRDDTSSFRVGRTPSGNTWDGDIDELAVWGKELTDAELDELYNSGAATTCCPF